jgi:hypothetical protein
LEKNQKMSSLAVRLARAVNNGRSKPPAPATRESLLVSLLYKRATASRMGADEQEQLLRAQILWSLPSFDPIERDRSINAGDVACPNLR